MSYHREVDILQRSTSLEHIGGTTVDLVVFDINQSEGMETRQRVDERSNRITQTHGGKWKAKSDIPTLTRKQRSAMFKSDILPTRLWLRFLYSPTISGEYPGYFWMTSLTGISYAWGASFRRNPMSLIFNESDKGRTRRIFMFREFEKTTKRKLQGCPFS